MFNLTNVLAMLVKTCSVAVYAGIALEVCAVVTCVLYLLENNKKSNED